MNNDPFRNSVESTEGDERYKILPLITVGITCFNAASTIERALDSALAQAWPNLEVVVVDDGSVDDSRQILARRAATEARLRVIEHPVNRGCAAARNTIVEEATGAFLAFFDDDDISRVDRLRLQYDQIIAFELDAETQLVACYASGQRIYPNGYTMRIRAVGSEGLPPRGHVMADYLLFNKRQRGIFYGAGTPTCSLMARTNIFRDLGKFDVAMRRQEDVDFAVRLAFRGAHFIGICEPVLTQYVTGGSEKSAQAEFESFLRILDKNAGYLRAKHVYEYMRLWSEMRYWHFAGQDWRAALVFTRLILNYPLKTIRHFMVSASARLRHEVRINADG
jgi:glycosyltransferase involved in cell wall biosynthesis